MRYPSSGPNTFIQVVSAVEGLSRSLVINRLCATGQDVEEAYERVKYKNPINLVKQCIKLYLGMKPEEKFGEEIWGYLSLQWAIGTSSFTNIHFYKEDIAISLSTLLLVYSIVWKH
jgi:hypothetical protein